MYQKKKKERTVLLCDLIVSMCSEYGIFENKYEN